MTSGETNNRKEIRLGRLSIQADWGELALTFFIAGFSVLYCVSAASRSASGYNLMLIVPCTIIILVCLALIIAPRIHFAPDRKGRDSNAAARKQSPVDLSGRVRTGGLMGLAGAYVLSVNYIGLDVATFSFVTLCLLLLEERRPLFVVLFASLTTAGITAIAKFFATTPIPFSLLP